MHRPHSWLAFPVLIVILASVVLVWPPSHLQAEPMQQTDDPDATDDPLDADSAPAMPVDDDHTGQSCGSCHLDYHAAWATGVHSIAFDRDSFQSAWQQVNEDPTCLACHATGYQPATGEFLANNVQCEACHGVNPADHPPAEFVVDEAASLCGDCHTSTFDEWEHSLHAFATDDAEVVDCATCHNPHGQALRAETVAALCTDCHSQDDPTYIHLTHNDIADDAAAAVTCASCHMFNVAADDVHQFADHSMTVTTRPCNDCHETLTASGNSILGLGVNAELIGNRADLQTSGTGAGETLTAAETGVEAPRPTAVLLLQGLLVGLGLGVTVAMVVSRSGRG